MQVSKEFVTDTRLAHAHSSVTEAAKWDSNIKMIVYTAVRHVKISSLKRPIPLNGVQK